MKDYDLRHWNLQQDGFGGTKQPVDVLLESENAAVVGADPFEDAVAVQQAMIEDRDRGLALVVELSVDINFHDAGKAKLVKRRVHGKREFA